MQKAGRKTGEKVGPIVPICSRTEGIFWLAFWQPFPQNLQRLSVEKRSIWLLNDEHLGLSLASRKEFEKVWKFLENLGKSCKVLEILKILKTRNW